jgi:cyclic beta-1,2-glucan synthetase
LNTEPERLVEGQVVSPSALDDVARRLAGQPVLGRGAVGVTLLDRLEDLEKLLARAQRHYAGLVDQKLEIPSGAEWLLDNFYLVQQVVRQVRQDVPEGFYPASLAEKPFAGLPRIYVLATELTSASEIHLDPEAVRRFVTSFQTVAALTIGELWALPAVLRLAVLDRLGQAVGALLDGSPRSGEASNANRPRQGGIGLPLVATCILDLRAIDIEDWKTVFEEVSRVEQILRRDPAQIYARMDFETRDRYRKAVERLAWSAGVPEEVVAQQATDLASGDRQLRAEGFRRW